MEPELVVLVVCYNQKDYIEKCLNSIFSQVIDIPFFVLIHDDCSNDGTKIIIEDFLKKYPNRIKTVFEKERVFIREGFNMMIYSHIVPVVGDNIKYIAYCDGDDYWCDPYKLQKQYDFMESHPDYSMCFHPSHQLEPNGKMDNKWYYGDERDFDMYDFVNDKPGIRVATSSIFIRREAFVDFQEWRKSYPVEDVPMFMNAALYGKIRRLTDIMSVYRKFAAGSWSEQNQKDNSRIITHLEGLKTGVLNFDEFTNGKYHNLVIQQIESCDFRIAMLNKDYKTVFSKQYKRFLKRMSKKERLSLWMQYRLPKLYNFIHKIRHR